MLIPLYWLRGRNQVFLLFRRSNKTTERWEELESVGKRSQRVDERRVLL